MPKGNRNKKCEACGKRHAPEKGCKAETPAPTPPEEFVAQ